MTQLLRDVKAGTKTQEVAIEEYVDEMVQRAGEEVKMSVGNTEMLHDWNRFVQSPIFRMGGHATKSNKIALEEQRVKEEQLGEAKTSS